MRDRTPRDRPRQADGGVVMTSSVEDIARDRGPEFRLGSEARFPLDLTSSVAPEWAAYESAIAEVWDPENPELWIDFDPAAFSSEAREAGALVWSHRTWVEYPAIAESEAVLVRACLEPHVGVDFKYCLSLRAVERARSTDLSHLLAKQLGTYLASPLGPELMALLDADLVRRALHELTDLDAYVGAHLILQGEIDAAMWAAGAAGAHPVIAEVMGLVVRDKARMLGVAWSRFAGQVPRRDAAGRSLIGATIAEVIRSEELAGRQVPALLGPSEDRDRLCAAHEQAAHSGLGGVAPDRQVEIANATIAKTVGRLSSLGIEIDDGSST